MTRKTTPITTTTKKVTTTTVTTVETVEVRTIYLDFSCSFDGTKIVVAALNSIVVMKTEENFEVLVGEDDTTVLRLAEPTLNGVAATFRVQSSTTEFDSKDWTHNTAGFESPAFPNAATVKVTITATLAAATGGDASVAAGDDLAAGDGTEKSTTLIVIIKKPGMGDPVITGG